MAKIDPQWQKIIEEVKKANEEQMRQRNQNALTMPTFRQMGMRGVAYKAIKEAHDGEMAIKNKSEFVARSVSMVYLMDTESMELMEGVESLLDRDFRQSHEYVQKQRRFNNAFFDLVGSIKQYISAEEMKKFNVDLEVFDANVRSFAKLESKYGHLPTPEEEKKVLHDRIMNLDAEIFDRLSEYCEKYGKAATTEIWEEIKAKKLDYRFE